MKLSRWVFLLAAVAAASLIIAGPGTRFGWWDFRFGFQLMRWAVYLAAGAGVLSLLLLLFKSQRLGQMPWIIVSFWMAVATAYVPLSLLQKAQSVPRIHDISTDTVDVPPFVAIAPLRENASNPLAYPGEPVAQSQKSAYPDIQTYQTEHSKAQVFQAALTAAQSLGWQLVDQNFEEGRIEASDETYWFGFIDDVVIRIESTGQLTSLDVRSKSRVGQSDVGKNAERIRMFLALVSEDLASSAAALTE